MVNHTGGRGIGRALVRRSKIEIGGPARRHGFLEQASAGAAGALVVERAIKRKIRIYQ
jgi:hypothetical protein